MKKRFNLKALAVLSVVLVLALASGVFIGQRLNHSNDRGSVVLYVNPAIRVDYDRNGIVVGVYGENEDGIKIVQSSPELVGLECKAAIEALVVEINEAGYFENSDNRRNILLKFENGSVVPSKNFENEIGKAMENKVRELSVDSELITIDQNDYQNSLFGNSRYISFEKAKEIALAHAGVSAEGAIFDDRDFDLEKGKAVYELEFYFDGVEYEYEIDAENGAVLRHKVEHKRVNDDKKHDEQHENQHADHANDQLVVPSDEPKADQGEEPAVDPVQPSEEPKADPAPVAPEYIGVDRAKEIALAHANVLAESASFIKEKLERDDGRYEYDIEFVVDNVKYEYEIDAVSGEIIKSEKEQKKVQNDKPVVENAPASEFILAESAKEIALAHAGVSASRIECELDREGGRYVYEIEFKSGNYEYDYEIDAISAEIIKSEKEFDD